MSTRDAPRVAVGPEPGVEYLVTAVRDGGGEVVPLADAEALVWADQTAPEALRTTLDAHPQIRWVQLPWAGIEPFAEYLDRDRTWTCGKGVYADPVAELALSMGLAGLRHLSHFTHATEWSGEGGHSLLGGRVTIIGGGGITESLVRLLQPFDCHITVVRNRAIDVEGADEVLEADRVADALPGADLVVLALSLTPETEGLIGREELALMEPHSWLVNVARGRHVVTDDLVDALRDGVIGGAGLDVTEPEPLPDDHPLWTLENCIITPHTATTRSMAEPLLARRVTENVRRYAAGDDLIGPVHLDLGY